MPIRVLDTHTAELIAAGEVVERPASVVKELVENAIDAGASMIGIDIRRGGISLIRIQDDGSGIAAEEIQRAFLRHATSKVATQEDLDAISTLGFRGEALASIASVSQVQLLTKTVEDEFASLYRIEGGAEVGLEAAAGTKGAVFSIANLFYNTPARMKFLKKDASEGTYVTEVVSRLALSHPEIAFRYTRDDKKVFATPGDGKLESAVYAVLGAQFAKGLIPVEGSKLPYMVEGLVTPPIGARASRSMQFFYINGRFVKNRTIMAALEQAYRGTTMHGKFPGGILFLTMPPELVDVNVHPAKTEVRFAKDSDIFDAVYRAVKGAVHGNAGNHGRLSFNSDLGPEKTGEKDGTLDLDGTGLVELASGMPTSKEIKQTAIADLQEVGKMAPTARVTQLLEDIAEAKTEVLHSDSSYIPYETRKNREWHPEPTIEYEEEIEVQETKVYQQANMPGALEKQAENPLDIENNQIPHEQISLTLEEKTEEKLRFIGEVFKTYILAESNGILCVIDKHAAHERILYEKLVYNRNEVDVQQLLSPVSVTLSAEEKNAILQNQTALLAAGIEADDFGGNTVLIRGVPADVEPDSVSDLIIELADKMVVNAKDTMDEKTLWVLSSISCRAAIKAGDKTTAAELLTLAEDILNGTIPPFCPHGRPVVLELSRKELEKQFGRLG